MICRCLNRSGADQCSFLNLDSLTIESMLLKDEVGKLGCANTFSPCRNSKDLIDLENRHKLHVTARRFKIRLMIDKHSNLIQKTS